MSSKKGPDICGSVAIGIIIGGGWAGWIAWELTSRKSVGTVLGLVAACLFLSWLSYVCREAIGIFVLSILAAPFAVVYIIGFLGLRLLFLVLSPLFVFNIRPFFNKIEKPQICRLCDKCDAMIDGSKHLTGSPWIMIRSVEKHEFYTRSELEISSTKCHLCQLLYKSVTTFGEEGRVIIETTNTSGQSEALKLTAISTAQNIKNSPNNTRLTVKIWLPKYWLKKCVLHIQLCGRNIAESKRLDVAWEAIDGHVHRCHDSVYTDSDEVLKWAGDWVEKCSSEHKLCQNEFVPSSQKDYAPLRLIDVSNSQAGSIHLVTTSQPETEARISYCALSHCWGGKIDIKLTLDNLKEMTKSIQVQTLPRNFQDAVTIAARLGFRYLWIDSLCIVQNNPQEWEIESAKMGLVYANAKFVISATSSADATGGCFRQRALSYNYCAMRKIGQRVLLIRPFSRPPMVPFLFEHLIHEAPLNKRGWTFQERYLAGRTLHFSDGFVLFECNTLTACEHDKDGQVYKIKPSIQSNGKLHLPVDILEVEKHIDQWTTKPPNYGKMIRASHKRLARRGWEGWERRRKTNSWWGAQQDKRAAMLKASARIGIRGALDFLWRFQGETLEEKIEFHNSWFELVQQYSTRQLTFDADKGMAIAGVASIIQQNTGFKYVAGLWLETLLFDLLWVASSALAPRPVWNAPTWSWASIHGMVHHRLAAYEENPRTEYAHRHCLTTGRCFRNKWEELIPLIAEIAVLEEEAVQGLVQKAILRLSGYLLKPDTDVHDHFNLIFDASDHPPAHDVFYLPVLSFINDSIHPQTSLSQLHGIILERKGSPLSQDQFQRVGYFWATDLEMVSEVLKSLGTKSTIEIL